MALNKKTPIVKTTKTPNLRGPVKVTKNETVNHEGASALAYGEKAELFLAATGSLHGEGQFYRAGDARDARVSELAKLVAVKDPDWMRRFLPWLRHEANIRTSAITIAVDAAYAWLSMKTATGVTPVTGGRQLIDSVLARADEPGEALAYAMSTYGRAIPKPVKRGIADAAGRLYNEFNWLKWDSASDGFRFADVLELCHVESKSLWQSTLFKHILDRRHNREIDYSKISISLSMIYSNRELRRHMLAGTAHGQGFLNPATLKVAGMTWEDVLSGCPGVPKHDLWNALIPTMGYMALLRNLRNFEEAGVASHRGGKHTPGVLPERIREIQEKLADFDAVSKSKQLPMRFLAAYRNVRSDIFKQAINEGLEHSLSNVPSLPGRTLILVDQSPSMFPGPYYSGKSANSEISLADQAKIFGSALALRAEKAKLVQYGDRSEVVPVPLGTGLLRLTESFKMMNGTDTARAVRESWIDEDRIIVITDEQGFTGDVFRGIPDHVLKYTWNLAGLGTSHAGSTVKNHVALGGLSDQMFTLLPILEARQRGEWPF